MPSYGRIFAKVQLYKRDMGELAMPQSYEWRVAVGGRLPAL